MQTKPGCPGAERTIRKNTLTFVGRPC